MFYKCDDDLAFKMRAIRTHGGTERFKHTLVGTNGRLNTIQAGILLVKLKYFDEGLERRIRNAEIYNKKFSENRSTDEIKYIDDDKFKINQNIITPYIEHKNTHVYGQYTIQLNNKKIRDDLHEYLKQHDIDSAVFYPISIHTQEAFAKFNYKEGDFPISEDICNKVLSLPVYPELTEKEIEHIADIINKFDFDSYESNTDITINNDEMSIFKNNIYRDYWDYFKYHLVTTGDDVFYSGKIMYYGSWGDIDHDYVKKNDIIKFIDDVYHNRKAKCNLFSYKPNEEIFKINMMEGPDHWIDTQNVKLSKVKVIKFCRELLEFQNYHE